MRELIRRWQSRERIKQHTRRRLAELKQRRADHLADLDQWSERLRPKMLEQIAKMDEQIAHLEKQVRA